MVFVERPLRRAHALVVLPRLRDHHHDRVGDRAARPLEELEGIVELTRVAGGRVDDREELPHVVEERRREHRLAGVHPVHVAAERVDLAVVGDEAIGMCPVPRGEGVGREALVDERQRGDEERVREVVVEGRDLLGLEEALVGDRPGREARDVEPLRVRHAGGPHQLLDALPDDVELPLEGLLSRGIAIRADEHLANLGQHRPCERPRGVLVDRDVTPAEEGLPFLGDHPLDEAHAGLLLGRLLRQEDHPDAVAARGRERDALGRTLATQKRVGDLHEDARPVAGQRIAPARPAVGEVLENGQALLDDRVRALALDVDHDLRTERAVAQADDQVRPAGKRPCIRSKVGEQGSRFGQ